MKNPAPISVTQYLNQQVGILTKKVYYVGFIIFLGAFILGTYFHYNEKYNFLLSAIEPSVSQAIPIGNEVFLNQISASLTKQPEVGAITWTFINPTDGMMSIVRKVSHPSLKGKKIELSTLLISHTGLYYVWPRNVFNRSGKKLATLYIATKLPILLFFLSIAILIGFVVFLTRKLNRSVISIGEEISKPIEELSHFMTETAQHHEAIFTPTSSNFLEFTKSRDTFIEVWNKSEEAKSQLEKSVWDSAVAEMARKARHDGSQVLMVLESAIDSSTIETAPKKTMLRSVKKIRKLFQDIPKIRQPHTPLAVLLSQDKKAFPCHLFSLVKICISEFNSILKPNVSLQLKFDPRLSTDSVVGPFSLLERAIGNLLHNAQQSFVGASGKILISVDKIGSSVSISVEDDGCGISPEKLKQIKDEKKFTTKPDGSGEGLSICRDAANAFHGKLEVNSQVGFGTVVSINIPLNEDKEIYLDSLFLDSKKIIIHLDDDEPNHWMMQKKLEEFKINNKLMVFKDEKNCEKTIEDLKMQKAEFLLLADYNLGTNIKKTGLDLIKKLEIQKNSVLITNSFDSAEVIYEAKKEGVRILPKIFLEKFKFQQIKTEPCHSATILA